MNEAEKLIERIRRIPPPPQGPPVDGNGSSGDDGDMETDRRLTAIETLLPTLMTKTDGEVLRADLHKMDASIKTWMIATIIGLFFGFAGLFFAMSNSLRPPSAPQASAPIIIQVPSLPPALAAPPSQTK